MSPRILAATKRLLSTLGQSRSYSAPADRSIPAAKQKYVPSSGTYPKGFLAGSAFAGVKASNTKYDDLALVVSEEPCAAAATFTRNRFRAAPVVTSQRNLKLKANRDFRGVVVNSGCANAITGQKGFEDANAMAVATDKCFNDVSEPPRTLVMSTGVIGQQLPIQRITDAIPKLHASLGSSHDHWLNAAHAICTTDTFPKLLSRTFTLPSHPNTTYTIAGMTKGAGMIHPNMATLLGIICTDASIEANSLAILLKRAINDSFNSISIDGDTSTNDTVALFANGAAAPAGSSPLRFPSTVDGEADPSCLGLHSDDPVKQDLRAFFRVLEDFNTDLAKLVVRDGEGATKFVTIRVQSALDYLTAKRAALSIARSALVKTALYGKDANWGRILCAIGYAPGIMDSLELPSIPLPLQSVTAETDTSPHLQPDSAVTLPRTSVSFVPADGSPELRLLVRGEPEPVDEARAKQILELEDLEILVRLDDSEASSAQPPKQHEAVFYTCDLSHEYVTINGDYRT